MTTVGHPASDPSKPATTAPVPSKHGIAPPVSIGSGRKRYTIHSKTFDVPEHYDITKPIGFGAYGFVCGGVNRKTGQKVAIKKCANVFKEIEDGKRILREIKLLSFMRHENILGIIDLLPPGPKDSFKDVYIVCHLMDTDLNHVLRSQQKLMDEHYTYFVYQILRGLKYMHSACIMHRDLKPANLLCNIACDLRICDFGLARAYNPNNVLAEMTDYVVTRWYRPPELLFMERTYTPKVDIWSTGCIFAEMITRQALMPGKDYLDQLRLLTDAVGIPKEKDLEWLQQPEAKQYLRAQPPKNPRPLQELVPGLTNPLGVDFLSKMLTFLPADRWDAAQLLSHPYLSALHDPSDEPEAGRIFAWEDDRAVFTEATLREGLWNEILAFHPELADVDPRV